MHKLITEAGHHTRLRFLSVKNLYRQIRSGKIHRVRTRACTRASASPAGCRSISEGQGKGLVFIIIAMGIVETVGLFGFVFLLLVLP